MARAARESRRSRERGSAIIEAAFVTPVFFLLIFGVFEFGFLIRNYLSVTNATTEAARTASVAGDTSEADYLIIRTLDHALEPIGLERLDFVIIYEASGPKDTVPSACLVSPSAADNCNRYTPSDFFLGLDDQVTGDPLDNWRCVSSTQSVDRYWCPSDRETALNPGPDYIGVYIQANHNYLTGFIGESRKLTNNKIIRIEPDRVS